MSTTSLASTIALICLGLGLLVWDRTGLGQLVAEGALGREQAIAAAGLVLTGLGLGFGMVSAIMH